MYPNELYHHGKKGMHWGVRNGPPYPLESSSQQKILNGYSAEDVQKYFDSVPEGDVEYGLKHKDYKETIYRDISNGQGFVELYKSPEGDGIASIAVSVHPNARRKGLATKLVNGAKDSMTKLGVNRIEWYCKKTNESSVQLAKKCGFMIDEELSTSDWYVLTYDKKDELRHHGKKGMHWGVRNGPPYPLTDEQIADSQYASDGKKESKFSKAADAIKKHRSNKRIAKAIKHPRKKNIRKLKSDELERYTELIKKQSAALAEVKAMKKSAKDISDMDKSKGKQILDTTIDDIGKNVVGPLASGLLNIGLYTSGKKSFKSYVEKKAEKMSFKNNEDKEKYISDETDKLVSLLLARVNKQKK